MRNTSGAASPVYPFPTMTGDPPPGTWVFGTPLLPPHNPLPNTFEQMGVDPISKLAAAIERLAAALESQQQ